ncbi:MAG: molecular chaperone HtpG [Clostridiales bacterium]|nr:molecular chaperone HtpG [Clostridiales bacterium]
MQETGALQVNSENILPIIKKWLYSDTDIFLRELVANGCDAVNKLKRMASLGEAEIGDDEKFAIHIKVDKEAGTLTVSDNGVGMDFDEVKLYINQIAKSSAAEFIEKYKSESSPAEIIGHFGLGFYSSFMAATKVEIQTLSHKKNAVPVRWVSDGGVNFEMSDGTRTERGTDIILTLNDESKEYLEDVRVKAVLRKYLRFMPVEIYFDEDCKHEHKDGEQCTCDHEHEHENGEQCTCDHEHQHENGEEHTCEHKHPEPINETRPLWLKNPSEVTDDEYKEFYHQLFTDFNPPLFWIHLNMEFPQRMKGILFFPKLNHELEYTEGQVKLYCNQVFIADNIKEVIPEFLLLLKGVMDCPDLPLNVSRSFLQNDGYASKMSSYITKKVADKLCGMFKNERSEYEKFWDDVSPFIKYGCIRERDFYEKMKSALIFKTSKGEYLTRDEYVSANESKIGREIYYTTDEKQQSRYIELAAEQGVDVAVLSTRLDTPFISYLETAEFSLPESDRVKFVQIDAAISKLLKSEESPDESNQETVSIFKEALGEKGTSLTIEIEKFKTSDVAAVIVTSEEAYRMREMSRYFGNSFGANIPSEQDKLVLNSANKVIASLKNVGPEKRRPICEHVYSLAKISHKELSPEEMNSFLTESLKILEILTDEQ